MNNLKINVDNFVKFKLTRLLALIFILINMVLASSCENEEFDKVTAEADSSIEDKSGSNNRIAKGNLYSNGVNLQPSYFKGGDPYVNWELMKRFDKIKTLRLEVDPVNGNYAGKTGSQERNEDVINKVRAQIKRANEIGLNIIVTYHNYKFNGSDNEADLLTAANWWKQNYKKLRGSGSDRKYRSFRINLSNEWGTNVNFRNYYQAYNKAISIVRQVYPYNIIIDCPGYGGGTRVAAMAFPHIKDKNITYSVHIYPNSWNKDRHVELDDLNKLSRTVGAKRCILGEFGNYGSSDANQNNVRWDKVVSRAKSLGWPVIGWAWNGHGNKTNGENGGKDDMNMINPSWEENSNTTNVSQSKYFYRIYNKL